MYSHRVPKKCMKYWIYAAISAPLAMLASERTWLEVLLAGSVGGFLGLEMEHQGTNNPKWLNLAQWIWVSIFLGSTTQWVQETWHGAQGTEVVSIILLFLGALASRRGAENASRASCTLYWVLLIIYVTVFMAGMKEMQWELLSLKEQQISGGLAAVFLAPTMGAILSKDEKWMDFKLAAGMVALGTVISVLVTGGISMNVIKQTVSPYHEWVKGIRIGQIAQRFETIASSGLTIGWFVLFAYLFSVSGAKAEQIIGRETNWGVWITLGIAILFVIWGKQIDINIIEAGTILIWVAIPVIISENRKNQKNEKNG